MLLFASISWTLAIHHLSPPLAVVWQIFHNNCARSGTSVHTDVSMFEYACCCGRRHLTATTWNAMGMEMADPSLPLPLFVVNTFNTFFFVFHVKPSKQIYFKLPPQLRWSNKFSIKFCEQRRSGNKIRIFHKIVTLSAFLLNECFKRFVCVCVFKRESVCMAGMEFYYWLISNLCFNRLKFFKIKISQKKI